MKKVLLLIVWCHCMMSCTDQPQEAGFESWYAKNKGVGSSENCEAQFHHKQFLSSSMTIDGIVKSMTGDMSSQEVAIDESGEELIWVTGCKLNIINSETGTDEPSEYLCHSIVNYAKPNELPWKILTDGTDKRMFTLSQGVDRLEFPEGFAIPLSVPVSIAINNQVLNLRQKELKKDLKYAVDLQYLKNTEVCQRPIALYQQPIFVTKKLEGPPGGFYQKDTLLHAQQGNMDTAFAQCGISYEDGYNPYQDPMGRKFTGHWIVSTDSIEVLKTNVTPMLNLKYNTRIHYIAIHVHPHAHSLELVDRTTQQSLYKALVQNEEGSFNIKQVKSFSSEEGIPVFVDHEYELISTYVNPNRESDITAMATMFLYLAEGE